MMQLHRAAVVTATFIMLTVTPDDLPSRSSSNDTRKRRSSTSSSFLLSPLLPVLSPLLPLVSYMDDHLSSYSSPSLRPQTIFTLTINTTTPTVTLSTTTLSRAPSLNHHDHHHYIHVCHHHNNPGMNQAVDLAWGMEADDQNVDQGFPAFKMEEIARCQRESCGPNFVVCGITLFSLSLYRAFGFVLMFTPLTFCQLCVFWQMVIFCFILHSFCFLSAFSLSSFVSGIIGKGVLICIDRL